MDFTRDITKIKELLDKAQDVLVVTHEHPTHDSMGSALALYLGLTGLGKKVTIACPDAMTVELSNFVGANKVITSLGKKNFIISLDYVDGSIEKVSYNIEGNKFNLVIEPRPGFEAFSEDKVHYTHAGSSAALIFAVDTIHLGGLKKLFDEDKDMYATKPIINVDRHPNNANYGHTNMVNMEASSTAEVVAELLSGLDITLTEDIATNLFNALTQATNNFQNANVSVRAFELAAAALKAGAKRFNAPVKPQEETPSGGEKVAEPMKKEVPAVQAAPVAPATSPTPAVPAEQPKEAVPVAPKQAPPDWLKPKIFKSSNIS
jgi:nanoRNase/pAp phosphatase (c-di-AMP/oligoRNAs hydrolase)